ncbi:MAG TPA: histidine phosphatase family protein [Candidatus Saccharibacteria bacterium]|jgi:probable phosphoglycerate mutase|nr:histidine phosphatase family protein [Candidatus Saccharibacteria bacterium]
MKHLYFVRHGLSEMNKQGIFSSRSDTPLAPEGREQARQAGQQLKDKKIDLIVASPLQRAHDTAKIIAQELGIDESQIILNDLFVERDFGSMEGTAYSPTAKIDGAPGAEHSDSVIARATKGFTWLQARPETTILLVSHGAIGRALRHVVDPDSKPYQQQTRFENAAPEQLL